MKHFFFQSFEVYLEIFVVFQNFKTSVYSAISRRIRDDVLQTIRVPQVLSQPVTMGIIVKGTESNNTYSSESIYSCCMF